MTFVSARGRAGARAAVAGLRTAAIVAVPACAAFLATGCSNSIYYDGTPLVTLTGSAAGFSTYRLYIEYITITRNDGYVAYLLETPVQVDLAALNDHEEILDAGSAPTGTYTSATITLDYGGYSGIHPLIYANVNGTAVGVNDSGTSPVTGNGYLLNQANPPATLYDGVVTYTVNFDPAHPLVIDYQQSTRLQFDFNLEASNILDTSLVQNGTDTSPTVYANPVITPTTTPVDDKPVRARGVLVVSQPNMSDFLMNVQPTDLDEIYTQLGALRVLTTSSTYFNINGQTLTGAAGLTALNSLPLDSEVVAYGSIPDLTNVGVTPTFNATSVLAGTSVDSTLQGRVVGIVASRSDNLLVVRGGTYYPPYGYMSYGYGDVQGYVPTFANNTSIKVDPTTIVSQDGVASPPPSLQSISVGSLISVSGQGSYDPTSDYLTLDATEAGGAAVYPTAGTTGQVRILSTPLWGTLSSATTSSATVNLLQLGLYPAGAFTFTGTNSTPSSYDVATGSNDLSQVPAGSLVEMTGYPSAFGTAPPDFNATAATLPAAQPSELIVEWWKNLTPTNQPFSAMTDTSLTIDPTNAQISRQATYTGPILESLCSIQTTIPVISTAGASSLQLTVGPDPTTDYEYVYSSMSDFEKEITTLQNAGDKFTKLVAVGQCDSSTNTFNATKITLAVQP